MKVKLIAYTPEIEKIIYLAGRRCYSDDDIITMNEKVDENKIGSFIRARVKEGHDSILEHGVFTFSIEGVSRTLLAQLTRHRIASYSVESQRYVDHTNTVYVIPDSIKDNAEALDIFNNALEECEEAYSKLLELGIPKEDARYILPNATITKLIWTINCRSLRNFLKLRLDKRAQKEIRALANEVLKIVSTIAPNVFYDFLSTSN